MQGWHLRAFVSLLVAGALLLPFRAAAQHGTPPRIVPTITTEPIVLDGELDEPIWREAIVAGDFVQSEPREGARATEVTEVRVLYDAEYLYFGIYCFQSDPATIIVNELTRNFAIANTDVFGIALDTFNDRRSTFTFFTNPGGAQRDEQSFDDGRFLNRNWDGIWDVATRLQPDGWSAEIRIPFRTLRFHHGTATFGINFFRNIRHKNEQVYWSPVPRRFSIHRASLAGELGELQGIRPGRSLRIKPGLVARAERVAGEAAQGRMTYDVALDAKYGLTQGLILDLTYAPDFSQAEVDTEQINLSRFDLFFPEKRDFFLENEGLFHFGDIQGERGGSRPEEEMRLFYSRRIGLSAADQPIPIAGGVRLSGRAGPFTTGLLTMQQRASEATPATNFSILRFRRDIMTNSDIGFVYVGRESSLAGDYNRAYGVDANFQFNQNLTANMYLAQTATPGVQGDAGSKKLGLKWNSNRTDLQLIVTDTGENFNPEAGFVERTGLRHYRGSAAIFARPTANRMIRELEPHAILRYSADQDGQLLARDDHYGLWVRFHDGARMEYAVNRVYERLDHPFRIRTGIIIPPGEYRWARHNLVYNSNRSKFLSATANYRWGTFWNGNLKMFTSSVFLVRGPRLNGRLSYSRNQVELPTGSFVNNLTGVKVDYSFNPRTFLSAFVQYNSETERWITNMRFRLIHRPLSDIFVVYTENTGLMGALGSRGVLVKYTHALEF